MARWATRCIDLGPGTRCTPFVIGPSNTPPITDRADANENVELAVLSAIEHAQSADAALTARTAPQALEAIMNSLGYEYQSDFARRYFFEGKAEGRVELILKQLSLRFGPLTEAAQGRVRSAQDAQLDTVAERVLTAQTLEEALALLA
jgi:uncharacterized protein DUF4351